MAKQFILLVFLLSLCAVKVFSQVQPVTPHEAQALCQRVDAIKALPYQDEKGVDAVYDALVNAGEAVVPCLIDKITDTTIMPDPRCPHISGETRVGDVAYFVLVDITKIGFVELLPAKVQESYQTKGAYVYHNHINRKGNRKRLQAKLREWYRQKQGT